MAHLIADYAKFGTQMKGLADEAISQVNDDKKKQELEERLKTILATKTINKDNKAHPRRYEDLIRFWFNLTIAMRIEKVSIRISAAAALLAVSIVGAITILLFSSNNIIKSAYALSCPSGSGKEYCEGYQNGALAKHSDEGFGGVDPEGPSCERPYGGPTSDEYCKGFYDGYNDWSGAGSLSCPDGTGEKYCSGYQDGVFEADGDDISTVRCENSL